MKKLVVLLLLFGLVTPLFAEDALMLPQNVWRFRVVPSATFQSQVFDDSGDRQDITLYDSAAIYNLSSALEYGVTDWITAALQWTPGWRMLSVFENAGNPYGDALAAAGVPAAAIPDNDKLSSTGLNDLFIGGKFQIVGENAPVANNMHRLAAAAGVIVPLSTYDAKAEAENYIDEKEYQPERVDKDVLGLGTRLYYDWVISDSFFVNLYNEFIYYLPRDLEKFGVTFDPGAGAVVPDITELEYEYGYDLTFELEPTYSTMIGDGLELGASLPVTYKMAPETVIEGTGQKDESYTLSLSPSVNLFLQSTPWPIDFELTYSVPVLGKNANASNTIALQIKNYLQLW